MQKYKKQSQRVHFWKHCAVMLYLISFISVAFGLINVTDNMCKTVFNNRRWYIKFKLNIFIPFIRIQALDSPRSPQLPPQKMKNSRFTLDLYNAPLEITQDIYPNAQANVKKNYFHA